MLNETFTSTASVARIVDMIGPDTRITSPVVLASLVVFGAVLTVLVGRKSADRIPELHGPPIFGHFRFFSDRYFFVNEGVRKLGSIFQFKVLNYKIVAVSGEQARKLYLTSGSLSFKDGYSALHGSNPKLNDVGIHAENGELSDSGWFQKRIIALLRKDRLERLLPKMFDDVDRLMKPWGSAGKFDPLDDVYKIVFQLTVRAGGCSEIADNPVELEKLMRCFMECEKTTSATSVLLTWWPSKGRLTKLNATRRLYRTLNDVLVKRRASGRKLDDAMQVLIDEGSDDNDIIQFIITTLFAGQVNTGIMSGWMMMYLGTRPEWKVKVIEEVRSFVAKYTTSAQPSESLATRLSRVPPSVWEEEMPLTDLCLRETIRLVQSSVFLRRNVGEDMVVNGHKINPGDFLVYPVADVHHNPEIYKDPLKFDPSRYERQEDRKQPYAFVGWGAGRHPCLGMRFAKLEVKCIIAMFLTGYDYNVVDESGSVVTEMPVPDRNILYDRTKRPGGKPIYIQYQRLSA